MLSSLGQAQIDEYGLSWDLTINSLTPKLKNVKGTKQAVSNGLVYGNSSTSIGIFYRTDHFIYGANFDVSTFADDFMTDEKAIISDQYYNHEQFVYSNLKSKTEISNSDVGLMFLYGIKIVGNDKARLYLSNRAGMKNVTLRTSNVVLKESGSNNYYFANYKFRISPIYSYIPSLEFEFAPFNNSLSFFVQSGVYFQYFTCRTQVDVINVNNTAFTSPDVSDKKYKNISTSFLTGIGIRATLW